MKRRDILKSIAAIPAAGLAQTAPPQTTTKTPPQPAAFPPAFFNPHQSDTITDFVDLLISQGRAGAALSR